MRLPAAVPVDAMLERTWEFLAGRGIERDRPDTWPAGAVHQLQALRRSGAFAPMASPVVRAALDELLSAWRPPKLWGLPLVTFPEAGSWRVPTTGWHLDSHGPEHDLPGVTVFAFLGPVAPAGGGTVVLAGSHRLVNRHMASTGTWRPAEVRAALAAAHPWLAAVLAGAHRPGDGAVLDGVPVTVRELTGEPGDVVLMHLRTLHTAAPDTGDRPRLMLVEIIQRATPA